ncbi:hypothetical protein SNE40_009920 [Patella caerulea]|uniref:Solute carrier organic anion transporter family member n=2 Tax=Patella caerulea TaxID=87958 RepID=A0AAN8JSB8_PATCE
MPNGKYNLENGISAAQKSGEYYSNVEIGKSTDNNATNTEMGDDDVDVSDTSCGIGACKPTSFQCFANLKLFVFFYSFTAICTQTNVPYLSSQISAIEKQFQISSVVSGTLISCNEVGQLCFVLLVSYFGNRGHIPRIISSFALIYSFGMFITAIPYYFNPYYLPKEVPTTNVSNITDIGICSAVNTTSKTTNLNVDDEGGLQGTGLITVYIMGASIVVQGIGKSAKRSLSATYIDNNVRDKNKTGLYLGFTIAASVLGPGVAILVGSAMSSIPIDLSDTSLSTTDPRWIGCWWLGFVIFAGLGIVTSLPVLFFPKRMKSVAAVPDDKKVETNSKSLCTTLKGLPVTLIRIFKIPIFTVTLLAISIISFSITGLITFGPKYLQNQFYIPAWKANLINGVLGLFVSVFGTVLGGWFTSRFKMDTYKCAKFNNCILILVLALTGSLIFIGCDNQRIFGLDTEIVTLDDGLRATPPKCFCDVKAYLPVCGEDDRTYLNPCVVQCWNKTDTSYGGCMELDGGSVTTGICDTGCSTLIPYLIVYVLQSFIGTQAIVPSYLILIRSVPDIDKSVAIGLLVFTTSILGWLPAPIVYGLVIDGTCRVWNMVDGKQGSCQLYYLDQLRARFLGLESVLKLFSLFFYLVILFLSRRQALKENNEKTQIEEEEMKKRADGDDLNEIQMSETIENGDDTH